MAKTAYYKLELFFKHLHRWMLSLLYEKKVSKKVDRDDSWKKIKTQSSYFNPLYPVKAIGTKRMDNAVTLYLELQCSGKIWKR